MKTTIFVLFILLTLWSCAPSQKVSSSDKQLTIKTDSSLKNDSIEYELLLIDPEFDHWYLIHFSIAKDYSNTYYRNKNQVGVSTWNDYFTRNRYPRMIDDYIYWDNSIDYGMEVNRKLYWYFKYYEDAFNIRLFF